MTKTILIEPVAGSDDRLQCSTLTLESLFIDHDTNARPAVIGRIKVISLGYQKTVFARITFDDWVSYRDYNASYLESCEEGEQRFDIFGFGFVRNDGSSKNGEFVLSCIQDGVQYWDNNNERNYHFQLPEEVVATEKPELFATNWQATEHGELIVEESDYPHFQPHPLTPTKIRFYSTIRNAPEKEITPTKAEDVKHAYAYKDIVFQCLLDLYEPQTDEEKVVSVVKTNEECCMPPGEGEDHESTMVGIEQTVICESEDSTNPSEIQEDLIQAEEVAKRELMDEDAIFDKLEKEAEQSIVENATGSEIEISANKVEVTESNQCKERNQDDDDATGERQTEMSPENSNGKSDIESVEQGQSNLNDDSHSSQKTVEQEKKEVIENEERPKRKKKSLFSKLCCGQAEHD